MNSPMPIAARPSKPEATVSDIKAVQEAAKECGGMKRLEVMVVKVAALVAKTGSIDKVVQAVEFLSAK